MLLTISPLCKAPEPEPTVGTLTVTDADDNGNAKPDAEGNSVVTIIGVVIATVTVLGAAAVVVQGKSSVQKAEKARDTAAADDNRCARMFLVHNYHPELQRVWSRECVAYVLIISVRRWRQLSRSNRLLMVLD